MTVELVDPLTLAQWDGWVGSFPEAQFFHGSGWARVLRETYRHRPVYVCQRNEQGIEAMLPLMEVSSPLTGLRGVSLPFTDFCKSLRSGGSKGSPLFEAAMAEGRRRKWRYLESRSDDDGWAGASPSLSYWGHVIDLTGGVGWLFDALESAVRRGLRKAEKARLEVEFRTDMAAMRCYFGLHCRTRKRHGLPPQPWAFFANIQRFMAAAGLGEIGLVSREGIVIAGAVYLWSGRRVMYKFGASDMAAQAWRPNNQLMWSAMVRYAEKGLEAMHLGRTSLLHEGLRRFKLGFGAREERIEFRKYDFRKAQFVKEEDKVEGWHNRVFGKFPLFGLRLAGKMLYPHLS